MEIPIVPSVDSLWPNPIFNYKDRGSKSRDLIFSSVGRVCTTWEIIEANLAMIFGQFAESDSSAAQRAYGVISNASGRRDALEMAAEIYYDRHHKFPMEQFKRILSHYVKAASYRNKIAHGVAMEFSKDEINMGCFLVPSFFASKHKSAQTFSFWQNARNSKDEFYVHGNNYRFTHEDIDFLESKFQTLSEIIGRFFGYLLQTEIERMMKTGHRFMHDVRGVD